MGYQISMHVCSSIILSFCGPNPLLRHWDVTSCYMQFGNRERVSSKGLVFLIRHSKTQTLIRERNQYTAPLICTCFSPSRVCLSFYHFCQPSLYWKQWTWLNSSNSPFLGFTAHIMMSQQRHLAIPVSLKNMHTTTNLVDKLWGDFS